MLPQEFHKLLETLARKERHEAWRLYKTISPNEALNFVWQIQERAARFSQNIALRETPISYRIWGEQYNGAIDQMIGAARLPIAVAGALMPDEGYGLPIGGVLATE